MEIVIFDKFKLNFIIFFSPNHYIEKGGVLQGKTSGKSHNNEN